MCGIAGIIESARGFDPIHIKNMTDCLQHRGPDAEGFLFVTPHDRKTTQSFKHPDCNLLAALGHRRLSIIDLNSGIQPLSNENDDVWIVFNGEIYNHAELREELISMGHVFKTDHSDTEVIIHLFEEWGIPGFDRLNGIFAFGILDLQRAKLILARDHFGVKPLYYFHDGAFFFSSEIKAILATGSCPRKLNMAGLSDYLSFRYVPSPRTAFRDIYKIEAGGYLEFDIEKREISSTGNYTSADVAIDYGKPDSQWILEYQDLFEKAVRRQLVSDVEVGALLSGGVDSSAVCAVAAHNLGYPIRTYTVGFKDFPDGNELSEAAEFAGYLGTRHKNVVIDELNFVKILEHVAWFMDEPTATSSSIPLYHLTQEIKKDVKVVLTGQGADEPLAGYPRYWGERLYRIGFRHLRGLNPLIKRFPRQERLKRAFRSFSETDAFERFMHVYYLFNPEQKSALLKESLPAEPNPLLLRLFHQYKPEDNLGRMLYMDTRAWLPDDLLTYGDKATMVNSVEARVPILDKDLVHFIESMPSKLKMPWYLKGKLIHKKACEKWLPSFVIKRPKKGFGTPIDGWFRKELRGYVREQLLGGRIARNLFNTAFIQEMITKHQSGKEDFRRQLFALLMLEKWGERYTIGI